uniref:Uncharacterized protein n=1 Tax=Mycena chlorophos TaxID=658473 RepID=A0ABQ0M6L3_MYCCL|nr:predicted protein [Mycena chlorophos]
MAPKKFDETALPKLEDIKSGPVAGLQLDPLRALAVYLGIPNVGVHLKAALLEKVQEAMAITNDKNLERFVAHRGSKLKAEPRTSATKAAEDEVADKGTTVQPTGAAKTLLKAGQTSDPPASTTCLSSNGIDNRGVNGKKDLIDGMSDLSDIDDASSPPPNTPHGEVADNEVDDDDEAQLVQDESDNEEQFSEKELTVCAEVTKPTGETVTAWILGATRKNVDVIRIGAGKAARYTGVWKQLVPAVLASMSPEKGFHDCKIRPAGAASSIATVAGALKGEFSEVLELPAANRCTLHFNRKKEALVFAFTLEKPDVIADSQSDSDEDGKILPYAIVSARLKAAKAAKAASKSNPDSPEAILLRTKLDAPQEGWGTAKTMGVIKDRWIAVKGGIAKADLYYKNPNSQGSTYRFGTTPDFGALAGKGFNASHVEAAFHVGHTVAHNDRQVCEHADLQHAPLAKSWLSGDDSLYEGTKKKFSEMTRKQFLAYLATEALEAETKKTNKGKRKAAEVTLTAEEQAEALARAMAKKQKKVAEEELNSDDLDQASS